MSAPKFPVASALALALLPACGEAPTPPARGPNVLFLSLDSVRADELSVYGASSPWRPDERISPHLEQLAAGGLVFDQAISTTSWTLPSHVAMMTGLPDLLHGVTDNRDRLDSGLETLPELFQARGYRTAGFFSGPFLHPVFGFSQGFDSYRNCADGELQLESFTDEQPGAMLDVHHDSHADITSPTLVAAASDFLAEMAASEEPFFCFVHWWDPHYDYLAPAEYVERFTRPDFDPEADGVSGAWATDKLKRDWTEDTAKDLLALYHSELAFTDAEVGRLLARLESLGLAEDTIVVLVADHGDEFFEHGRWGHQRTLFDEVVHVPLILRYPGVLPAGQRVAGQARIQDLYASLADLADIGLPGYASEGTHFGRSLRPLWEDPEHPGFDQLLHLDVPHRGLRQTALRHSGADGQRWKVTLDPSVRRASVVDLVSDPLERAPEMIANYPITTDARVRRLLELEAGIEEARARLPLVGDGGEAELSAEMLAELERLGYL